MAKRMSCSDREVVLYLTAASSCARLWAFSPCYIRGSYILLCCLEKLGELSWQRYRGAQHPALSWHVLTVSAESRTRARRLD